MNFFKFKNIVSNNLYIIGMIWNASRKKIMLSISISAMQVIADFFCEVYFLRKMVETIEKGNDFIEFVKNISILLVFNTIRSLINAWYYYYDNELLDIKVKNALCRKMFNKSISIDYNCFENQEYYNKYSRTMTNICTIPLRVLDTISSIIGSLLFSVTVCVYVWSIDPVILIFAVCPFFANYLINYINKLNYSKSLEITKPQRVIEYVNNRYLSKESAKEIRMTNIKHVLNDLHLDAKNTMLNIIKKYQGKLALGSGIVTFVTSFLAFIGGNIYSAYRFIIKQNLSIADYSVLISSIISFNAKITKLFDSLVRLGEYSLYIQDIKNFLELEPFVKSGNISPEKTFESIEFKNVSFYYDFNKKNVLKNISFTIRHGEKIAIVGLNGAGKTTLVKLILRLYDPTEGEIFYNGKNIKEYNLVDYRSLFGTVFQDFHIFSTTLAENITMGTLSGKEDEHNDIMKALIKSDFDNTDEKWSSGIFTPLTREFDPDGAVISTGQEQKIALARMSYKNAQFNILDEPTASLDPVSEYRIFESLFSSVSDKATIIVSHRLSSVTMADTIIYLKNGAIMETGNHKELMDLRGEYSKLFMIQAERYTGV